MHTPYDLCEKILLKVNEFSNLNDKNINILILFNLEFVYVFTEKMGVDKNQITFLSDADQRNIYAEGIFGVKVIRNAKKIINNVKKEEWKMGKKFDVVIGNPPYQGSSNVKRSGKKYQGSSDARNNLLWPDFVRMGIDMCRDNGYVCLIHPPKWRKPEDALWNTITSNQIEYLEIHSKKDGKKTFGATTRYDWYVLKKTPCSGKTIVKDEKGDVSTQDLSKIPFIPNYNFDKISKIIATGDKPRLEVIYSTSYHHQTTKRMRPIADKVFKYPCIHGRRANDETVIWYSNDNTLGHFGIKKVILNDGETLYPIIDIKGEYGMTEHTFAIKVSSLKEAKAIKKAIESNTFKEIVKSTKWSSFATDYKMFKSFKKDFWREFI